MFITITTLLALGCLCLAQTSVWRLSSAVAANVPRNAEFSVIATSRGLGQVIDSIVGPGPKPGSERFYLSYTYAGGTGEIVAIDPESGRAQVFKCPVKGEERLSMVVGPDKRIYVGTSPHAHLLRLDPSSNSFSDLGRPSQSEEYIWQLAVGRDSKIYGGTYPSAKLVRFDPASGKSEDLGPMDPTEMYARILAASDDGFIYVGIGYGRARLVAYEIRTGRHQNILPDSPQAAGVSEIHLGNDRKVYVKTDGGQTFRVENWRAVPIPPSEFKSPKPPNRLKDGRLAFADENVLHVKDVKTNLTTNFHVQYDGEPLPIFRLGSGTDGMLYFTTALPIRIFSINPQSGDQKELGLLGSGEVYSILSDGGRLLMGAYGGLSALMSYDPGKPFGPGQPGQGNPVVVTFGGADTGWRPKAMIKGPDGKIYLGAVSGYGALGGSLTVWEPIANRVKSLPQLVQDESVVSLTLVDGLILGGTTIFGGGGSHPTQTEAKLFIWDPGSKKKIAESVPWPRATQITDLIAGPNGLVYGVAGKDTLFVIEPRTQRIVHNAALPCTIDHEKVFNSVAVGPDKRIWGLATEGVFVIDMLRNQAELVARSPEPVTAGFALVGDNLYFASGAKLYRYSLPGPERE